MAVGALIFISNSSPSLFIITFTFCKNSDAHNCDGSCHDLEGQLYSRRYKGCLESHDHDHAPHNRERCKALQT